MAEFELIVVLFRLRPNLHFFDLGDSLFLLGLLGLLALLVLVLAVVHDPADRRGGLRCHLHEIQFFLAGTSKCVGEGDNPQLAAVNTDETNLGRPDLVVDVHLLDYVASLLSRLKFPGVRQPARLQIPRLTCHQTRHCMLAGEVAVGDKVTSDIIRRYIKCHQEEQLHFEF